MKALSYIALVTILVLSPATVLGQTKNQMLELMQQLTRLETELRQLRGEVERLAHENKRMKSQQNDLYVDLDQRMQAVEQSASTGALPAGNALTASPQPSIGAVVQPSGAATAPRVPPSNTAATPPQAGQVNNQPVQAIVTTEPAPTTAVSIATGQPLSADPAKEQADYKNAFGLLKVGKYAEAITAYNTFLQQYPQGAYAPNAQYWLGEAHYVTRQFPQAQAEFRKFITLYPQARKLPDALLKMGYIHYELKEADEARKILTELKQQYPGTTPARLAENRLQIMKLEGR